MNRLAFLLVAFVIAPTTAFGQFFGVFINEFHYDNSGTDVGEFIEIAGPAGASVHNWQIVLYDGSLNQPYGPAVTLSGTIPNQVANYGTLFVSYPTNGIQNGPQDGIALVDDTGVVMQFLSYEGVLTPIGGPANGITSTDIGVAESGSDPAGMSLQIIGTDNLFWASSAGDDSPGSINTKEFADFPLPGDYNHDGNVSAADYVVWRKNPGGFSPTAYDKWRANFGNSQSGSGATVLTAVPEPAALLLVAVASLAQLLHRHRRSVPHHRI